MKKLFLCIGLWLCLLLAGCIDTRPTLRPEYTVPPEPTPTIAPTPTPEITPTPIPTPSPTPLVDVTGISIEGLEHFQRYLFFKNIQVYEQCDDSFVDAVIVNAYPQTIMCAVTISFFGEDGEELIAEGKMQTRDGEFVLLLEPGENTVFARLDTDMRLTDAPFKLSYDAALGVLPA